MFQVIQHHKQKYPPGHIEYPQRNMIVFKRSALIANYST